VATRLVILPVLTVVVLGLMHLDAWIGRHAGRRLNAASVVILLAALFLIVQLSLRAAAWRPDLRAAGALLPIDVLKDGYSDAWYAWTVWIGIAVSVASFGAMLLRARRSLTITSKPAIDPGGLRR
jgi:hypothetical protein